MLVRKCLLKIQSRQKEIFSIGKKDVSRRPVLACLAFENEKSCIVKSEFVLSLVKGRSVKCQDIL